MVSSPGLVIYAELLLLVQYIYGLQLTNDELPLQDPTGTFDYSELGLKKWEFPCLHLGAQARFSLSVTSFEASDVIFFKNIYNKWIPVCLVLFVCASNHR